MDYIPEEIIKIIFFSISYPDDISLLLVNRGLLKLGRETWWREKCPPIFYKPPQMEGKKFYRISNQRNLYNLICLRTIGSIIDEDRESLGYKMTIFLPDGQKIQTRQCCRFNDRRININDIVDDNNLDGVLYSFSRRREIANIIFTENLRWFEIFILSFKQIKQYTNIRDIKSSFFPAHN